jgi:cytochrome d ubiquinol oxidase subunit II
LFAFLAAVYLTVEARERELQEDFRRRALFAGIAVALLALTVFVLAKTGAPTVRAGISRNWWALGLHIFTAIFATGAFVMLWTRRYRLARVCAAAQVTLILLGWTLAQFPHLVEPDLTISAAAAPQVTLELLLGALAAGAILLFHTIICFASSRLSNCERRRTETTSALPGLLDWSVVGGVLDWRRRSARLDPQ